MLLFLKHLKIEHASQILRARAHLIGNRRAICLGLLKWITQKKTIFLMMSGEKKVINSIKFA